MDTKFVVFDGMDGSGKGTQINYLKKGLASFPVVFTREPGGPPLAEEIRKIIRDNPLAASSTAVFHFLGFWMAREESMHRSVMPALRSGKHVFSDRGDSSTHAFQLCGEEHAELLEAFVLVRNLVFGKRHGRREPDLYIVFDLPAEVARERALQDVARAQTHFDIRDLDYYNRVRHGFRDFEKRGLPVEFVDATQSPEEVHRRVQMILAAKRIVPEFAFVID
ncbi:MAG: dTMP kinase [Patescibacteria group bacterium]|nr:dTMP kinase [Patescibacteria group bacterium]